MPNSQNSNEIDEHIVALVKKAKPKSVRELVSQVRQRYPISEKEVLARITYLQEQQKVTLVAPDIGALPNLNNGPYSGASFWYWATNAAIAATIFVVLTIPESLYPMVYLRYFLGSVFILWLPGYALVKALFPTELPVKTTDKTLDSIERAALSIGLSLALVPMVGLVLNYTPWGITIVSVTLSLAASTASLATIAVVREYQAERNRRSSYPS